MTDERPIEELDPEVIPADGEDEEEALKAVIAAVESGLGE